MTAASLLLALLAGAAALALAQRQAARGQQELHRAMQRLAAALLEQARAEAQLQALRDLQRVAQTGVELGAGTVRAVHLGIAAIPFGILEAIPVTRPTSRLVRTIHDQISGVVYDSISGGNRLIGAALRLGLNRRAPPQDRPDDET
jgi:hypothetical protein